MADAKSVRLLSYKGHDSGGVTLRLRYESGRDPEAFFAPEETVKLLLAVTGAIGKRSKEGGFLVESVSLLAFPTEGPILEVGIQNGGRLPLSIPTSTVETLIGMLETMLGRAKPTPQPKGTMTH